MGLDGGGEEQQHPDGDFGEEGLWIGGKKVRVITRKPRQTLLGTLSTKLLRKVTGDKRLDVGVGGSINTHHDGDMERRTVENKLIKKEK